VKPKKKEKMKRKKYYKTVLVYVLCGRWYKFGGGSEKLKINR
jgi:hypothetical protein